MSAGAPTEVWIVAVPLEGTNDEVPIKMIADPPKRGVMAVWYPQDDKGIFGFRVDVVDEGKTWHRSELDAWAALLSKLARRRIQTLKRMGEVVREIGKLTRAQKGRAT